ncbi:MAG: hypothetical protein SGILL_001764 [Bacillariaceae sp.]
MKIAPEKRGVQRNPSLDSSSRSVSFSFRNTIHVFDEDDEDRALPDAISVSSSSSSSTFPSPPPVHIKKMVDIIEDNQMIPKVVEEVSEDTSPKELLNLRIQNLTCQMADLRRAMMTQNDLLMNELHDVARGIRPKCEETDQALRSQLQQLKRARKAQAELQEALRLVESEDA